MSQLDAALWVIAVWMMILTAFFIHVNRQEKLFLDILKQIINKISVKINHHPLITERGYPQSSPSQPNIASPSKIISDASHLHLARERYLKLIEMTKTQDDLPSKLRTKIIKEYQEKVEAIDNNLKRWK
jgi:hypothetical protein